MNCPKCGEKLEDKGDSPRDGKIYVAEECVEGTYELDCDIHMFECVNEHYFYFNPNLLKED